MYTDEQMSRIVRPYSRISTTALDMNLSDEIAIFSDPMVFTSQEYGQTTDFADQLFDKLNKDINVDAFFIPEVPASASKISMKDVRLDKKIHFFSIEQDLNHQIYHHSNRLSTNLDMPSGDILEVLTQEYQFHRNNRKTAQSEIL